MPTDNPTTAPSFAKMATCLVVEALLFLFGVAQIAGTIVYIQDGELSDPSVWIVGAIGVMCILAIIPIDRWSVRP